MLIPYWSEPLGWKLVMDREGNITLSGVNITLEGSSTIIAKSAKIKLN